MVKYKDYVKHIEKVFRSCKTEEHLYVTQEWAKRARLNVSNMNRAYMVFDTYHKYFADIQREYLVRLNET